MLRPRKEFRSESVFGLVYFIHSVWIRTRALPFSMVAVKRKVTNHSTPKICFILPPVENQYILCVCRVVVTSTGAEGILSPDPEAVKRFPATEVKLAPRQAVVFTFVPSFP